jgi:hypothetical protein
LAPSCHYSAITFSGWCYACAMRFSALLELLVQ